MAQVSRHFAPRHIHLPAMWCREGSTVKEHRSPAATTTATMNTGQRHLHLQLLKRKLPREFSYSVGIWSYHTAGVNGRTVPRSDHHVYGVRLSNISCRSIISMFFFFYVVVFIHLWRVFMSFQSDIVCISYRNIRVCLQLRYSRRICILVEKTVLKHIYIGDRWR